MKILVSVASKHGATTEIGTRIAAVMRANLPGNAVIEERSAADAGDVASYGAVLLGSAVYMGRWMEDARKLAARITAHPRRSVWLFSSGPIGDPPKPAEEPVDIHDIVASTAAREHRVFAGRLDRHRLGFAEKAMVLALRVPDGDFRDWDALDAWAVHLAKELVSTDRGESA